MIFKAFFLYFTIKEIKYSQEVNYNCSDINNITELAQSITTKVFGLKNIGNTSSKF